MGLVVRVLESTSSQCANASASARILRVILCEKLKEPGGRRVPFIVAC